MFRYTSYSVSLFFDMKMSKSSATFNRFFMRTHKPSRSFPLICIFSIPVFYIKTDAAIGE